MHWPRAQATYLPGMALNKTMYIATTAAGLTIGTRPPHLAVCLWGWLWCRRGL